MRRWISIFGCALLWWALTGACAAGKGRDWFAERDALADLDAISGGAETPHVAWAVPLAGGPIRALFIAPRYTLRDVAELAQRLELEPDAVATWDAYHLTGELFGTPQPTGEEVVARIQKALDRKLDLIVLGNLDLSILPAEIIKRIIEKVKGGTGLLLAHHREHLPARFEEFLKPSCAPLSLEPEPGAPSRDQPVKEGAHLHLDSLETAAEPDQSEDLAHGFREALTKQPPAPSGQTQPRYTKVVTTEFTATDPSWDAAKPGAAPRFEPTGIAAAATPEWPSSLNFAKSFVIGQGRVVELDYAGSRPYTHCLIPALTDPLHARDEYFDVYLSLVAKAARWAAGRDASVAVAGIDEAGLKGPAENEIPPGLPEDFIQTMRDAAIQQSFHSYAVRLARPADRSYQVRAEVRDPERGLRTMYPDLPELRKGAASYPLDLPIGPGRYLLDLWLLHKKRVVEWHTEILTVKGWPEMTDVHYSKGYLLPNDALTVALTVRPQSHRPRPCTVYARGTDALGRVIAEGRRVVDPEGGRVEVPLTFADLMANLVKVEVFAADTTAAELTHWDLNRAAYHHIYLPVRNPRLLVGPRPISNFGVAVESRAEGEYNTRNYLRTLAALGVDAACVGATDEARFYLAERNLRPIPELTRYAPESVENGVVRRPCLSDPAFRQAQQQKLRDETTAFWTVGTSVYSLGKGARLASGDEEVCQCATCLEGFREALQAQYQSIERLNQAWGTRYADWEHVTPTSRADAAASGHYAGWLDFRRYMDGVFAGALVAAGAAVHGVDAEGHAGFRAAPGSSAYLGYDWWALASQLDAFAVEPDSATVELIRSYRSPRTYAALCTATGSGAGTPASARWLPWYATLHGMQAVWHDAPFGGAVMDALPSGLKPNGQPTAAFLEALAVENDLKSGVGALLLEATRVKTSIAVYDGQASLYLGQVDARFGCDMRQAQAAFVKLVEQSGRQCDFVSSVQVKQGKLKEYALVLLPLARALDDEEVAALEAFHAQGGRLIADVAPGEFDAHGVRRTAFPLDNVFGVRHGKPTATTSASGGAMVELLGGAKQSQMTWPDVTADASIEAAGAEAMGRVQDAPIWLVQGDNAGFTALLNHPLDPGKFQGQWEKNLAPLINLFLDRAAIRDRLGARPQKGMTIHGECVRFHYGAADLLAVLADPHLPGKREKIRIEWDRDGWVYDVRKGERIATRRGMRFTLGPGEAYVAATLPYEVTEVALTAVDGVLAGRRLPVRISVKAKSGAPGMHLVRLAINRGLAQEIPHYAQLVVCEKGEGQTYIPLALSDEPGVYTLTARDVLTGVSGRTLVNVGYKPPIPAATTR